MTINPNNVPQHIAIIMDGNGRWARRQGKDRLQGHSQGVESVRTVVKASVEAGVRYLTIYAFSTENWGRPSEEVTGLMELFVTAISAEIPELIRQGVRLKFIGNIKVLSEKVRAAIEYSQTVAIPDEKLTLVIALNYSSRWEITEMTRRIAEKVKYGNINIDDITDVTVSDNLTTNGIPDPELIIRTSGEYRLSNFLLWQAAYSEFYFTDTLWPDFSREDFFNAISEFQKRDRRFGLVK